MSVDNYVVFLPDLILAWNEGRLFLRTLKRTRTNPAVGLVGTVYRKKFARLNMVAGILDVETKIVMNYIFRFLPRSFPRAEGIDHFLLVLRA